MTVAPCRLQSRSKSFNSGQMLGLQANILPLVGYRHLFFEVERLIGSWSLKTAE
jgi:hypothetical protein